MTTLQINLIRATIKNQLEQGYAESQRGISAAREEGALAGMKSMLEILIDTPDQYNLLFDVGCAIDLLAEAEQARKDKEWEAMKEAGIIA